MFINALGYYVPSKRITNDHFLNVNGLTSDWIVQRTGIISRSKAGENEGHDSMGLEGLKIFTIRGIKNSDLRFEIFAARNSLKKASEWSK